ncbi:phage portal protein [Kineococcus gynurae]|uniref:Phage portal protein n=1 Tax=Kineococcus gynurae TaxID=452979 RepID=A0ABV5LWX5_9ACTN
MRALSALAGLGSPGRREASLENPNVPITGGRLLSEVSDPAELWSDGGGGDRTVTRVGAALRCVQIIAGTIAGCPINVTRRADRSSVDVPWLRATTPGTTPFEMMETAVAHVALRGNAFLRKLRSRDGRIQGLLPIHPTRVRVEVVDATEIGRPFAKLFVVDGKIPLTEYDVMHVPGLSLDGVTGISIIENVRRTFQLAESAERMATRFYERGMLLSGFLSTEQDLDATKADILKERWRAKLSGIDSAYDVAVLDKGTKFQQLSLSPADAQFLETRKFQTTEIARMFGLPGWVLNDQEKSTSWGSGMEQQFTSMVILTFKAYMQRFEQRLTAECLNPIAEKAEFKVEGLLRGDSKARAAFYSSGITNGWMVPNEARELEDMPPVSWGDEPYRPFNEPAGGSSDPADDDPADNPDDDQQD